MGSGHSFADSTRRYEAWLAQYCKIDDVGLAAKREKIKAAPFPFLRGTFYRWPHHFAAVKPRIAQAAKILSIGDTHIENFGTWRDDEGRHAWGANAFDEAAELPWTSDLVRLATSAILAADDGRDAEETCALILEGYRKGVEDGPSPFVLEDAQPLLRDLAAVKGKAARKFWEGLRKDMIAGPVPQKVQVLLLTCLPAMSRRVRLAKRLAGVGSLGRPRYVALAEWNGGLVAREAKAAVPSAVHMDEADRRDRVLDHRRVRALAFQPRDPEFLLTRKWIVRRLSPEANKIELDRIEKLYRDEPDKAGKARALLVAAMGTEIANVHLGTAALRRLLRGELKGSATTGWRRPRRRRPSASGGISRRCRNSRAASPQLMPSACMYSSRIASSSWRSAKSFLRRPTILRRTLVSKPLPFASP